MARSRGPKDSERVTRVTQELKPIRAALLLALALIASGCANTTTTKFSRGRDGQIVVESPKDIRITGLDAQLPDGTKIKIKHLSSRTNPQAVEAQGRRERENIEAVRELSGTISEGVSRGAVKGVLP